MNLRQIEAFHAVMTTGSVTAAAADLHVSQPAISRLIMCLEEASGLLLFQRKGRRLEPTPEGLAFHEEVKHSFNGLAALKHVANDIANFNGGQLRIAAQPGFGLGFLPKVISTFLAEHPNVRVSLQVRSAETVRNMAISEQFDIGFIYSQFSSPDSQLEAFTESESVCVLPKKHRLARKSVITPKDLEGEAFVSLARDDVARREIDQIFEDAGVKRITNIETQYAATICNFILNGAGVSILSPFAAIDYCRLGLIMRRFKPAVLIRYLLAVPTSRPQSVLAMEFITHLKSQRDREVSKFEDQLGRKRQS